MNNRELRYKALAEKYAAIEYGIWLVKGEDSNPGFGGSHSKPTLGPFEGFYIDVLDTAMTLGGFFTWGAGGSIEKVEVQKIEKDQTLMLQKEVKKLEELRVTRQKLRDQIKELGIAEEALCDKVKLLRVMVQKNEG